jgi:hypothetical protein
MAGLDHVLWEMPKAPKAAQPSLPLAQVAHHDNAPPRHQMDSLYPLREMMKRKLKLGKAASVSTTDAPRTVSPSI